jgi:hypothetical protein
VNLQPIVGFDNHISQPRLRLDLNACTMSVNTSPSNTDSYIDPSSLDAVYDLARDPSPLGEMVREAIGVIDRGLDIHGCVVFCCCTCGNMNVRLG